ncbi:hypothetical protein [Streptomyces sp. ITFR-16]|uniref:hypothetical protein n=1 Tax=Streptomyces sp. ITFR-16 TaxID=3075198 RepID=UPI00288A4EC7|nr:hypothetical protein [Streptomyces sp. ITFR-16]WNI26344.1 hypothetical protein RLT58_32685 [Streptomyces sp. ITFR-16]
MSEPSTAPDAAPAFLAVCAHTHLFPGARCRLLGLTDPGAFAAGPRPVDLALRFLDDVVVEAELRTGEPTGPVLAVPAHTTGAGTSLGARDWLVREFVRAGDDVELTIGGRLPD